MEIIVEYFFFVLYNNFERTKSKERNLNILRAIAVCDNKH